MLIKLIFTVFMLFMLSLSNAAYAEGNELKFKLAKAFSSTEPISLNSVPDSGHYVEASPWDIDVIKGEESIALSINLKTSHEKNWQFKITKSESGHVVKSVIIQYGYIIRMKPDPDRCLFIVVKGDSDLVTLPGKQDSCRGLVCYVNEPCGDGTVHNIVINN